MIDELAIPGAFVFTPNQFGDDRGMFLEWFRGDAFAETVGHAFDLRQANLSVSAAGVVRGIHFADVPPGQAKYISCPRGSVLDVVVDIRVGSPTFGQWDAILLDDVDHRCIYLAEGLGHAFLSLEHGSTVVYLCSAEYNPTSERGINPLDADIGIEWPTTGRNGEPLNYELSSKDSEALGLAAALESGLLPIYGNVNSYIESLNN